MSELFDMEAVKMDSPRLAWLKKHGVITWSHPGDEYGTPPCWFAGFQEWWPGKTGADFFCEETSCHGDSRCPCDEATEDEALAKLARWYNLPLWNEEAKP